MSTPTQPESSGQPQPAKVAPRRLGRLERLGRLALAFGLLYLAGPGVWGAEPRAWLTWPALGLWAATAQHPGRRAWLAEWFVAGVYFASVMYYTHFVFPLALIPTGIHMGFYSMLGGVLLRRFPVAWPLALTAPLAFVSAETLRDLLILPYGLGWLRIGHHAAGSELWLPAARIAGVVGLSFAFTALGGLIADMLRRALGREWAPQGAIFLWGLAPTALLAIGMFASPSPVEVSGPRVIGIQPNVSMGRKQDGLEPTDLIREQWGLTQAHVDPIDPPDLVVWAETMHPVPLTTSELDAALANEPLGVEVPPWRAHTIPVLKNSPDLIAAYVQRSIVDALPVGTAFATGMEFWDVDAQRLKRYNTLVLWERDAPPKVARKRYLVPAGESMAGLENLALVRDWIFAAAGYVPDLNASPRTERWSFRGRDGEAVHVAGTVCFDNAFAAPYLQPLEDGPVHLHLVVSNEVWYRSSHEYDQMLAFSKLAAAASGRSLLRVTNSGVSALIGPDGSERGRLVVDGLDRNVQGALDVVVPVPADLDHRTPWSRWWRVGRILGLLLGPTVAWVALRRRS